MTFRKKIFINNPNFEEIINSGYIYVDKTNYLRKIIGLISKEERLFLVNEKKSINPNYKIDPDTLKEIDNYYFMPGPRRFGKSLTLKVLKQLYAGNKDLFTGLEIDNYMKENDISWESVKRPVLYIDFSGISCYNTEKMKRMWNKQLYNIGKNYNIKLSEGDPDEIIIELIEKLYEKTNQKIVVLIDEYDTPIISNLGKGKKRIITAINNQESMRDFYKQFKNDMITDKIELLFITGISKFAKTSIFSALNNLIEIDRVESYAGIIGYSDEEFRKYFNDYVQDYADKEKITLEEAYYRYKEKFNGFRFWKKDLKLYNPFSIANALTNLDLGNYWFDSGTPSLLINLIQERKWNIFEYKTEYIDKSKISAWDIENVQIIPLLFQTGYLTIKEWESDDKILLDYPNKEVQEDFNKRLFEAMSGGFYEHSTSMTIKNAIRRKEYEKAENIFKIAFKNMAYLSIPPAHLEIEVKENDKIKVYTAREIYFQAVFFSMLYQMSGKDFIVQNEVLKSTGRIDILVEMPDRIIIYELKCDKSAEEAIKQIKRKEYAECFREKNKEIVLIGINFSSETKNIENSIVIENY